MRVGPIFQAETRGGLGARAEDSEAAKGGRHSYGRGEQRLELEAVVDV